MSWLTDNYLFDVTVFVATLQSATSAGQSQLADDQLSFDSIWTKEGKERHNNKNFHNDQLTRTQNFLTNRSTPSLDLWNNLPETYTRQSLIHSAVRNTTFTLKMLHSVINVLLISQ